MSKPWIHAESSAKRFGGKPEDYIEIHNLLDSSKAAICDSRHRALTHNAWFIGVILEKIFGVVIQNSDGKKVSVRDVGEQHVAEDFKGKFIPSAQDFLVEMELKDWMNNGKGVPPSWRKMSKEPEPQPFPLPTFPLDIPNMPITPFDDRIVDGSRPDKFPLRPKLID